MEDVRQTRMENIVSNMVEGYEPLIRLQHDGTTAATTTKSSRTIAHQPVHQQLHHQHLQLTTRLPHQQQSTTDVVDGILLGK